MAGQGGKRPGAGRKKGIPNKVTFDIKAAIQKHGAELIQGLFDLAKSKDERVQAMAYKELLDRGFGKAAQIVASDPDAPIEIKVSITKQE